MDLVESEDIFRPALSYALGSALVCDSLEDAQDLCFTKGEKVCKRSQILVSECSSLPLQSDSHCLSRLLDYLK
jgi:chromosome segregation ATPase